MDPGHLVLGWMFLFFFPQSQCSGTVLENPPLQSTSLAFYLSVALWNAGAARCNSLTAFNQLCCRQGEQCPGRLRCLSAEQCAARGENKPCSPPGLDAASAVSAPALWKALLQFLNGTFSWQRVTAQELLILLKRKQGSLVICVCRVPCSLLQEFCGLVKWTGIALLTEKLMSLIDLASYSLFWILIILKISSCCSEKVLTALVVMVHYKHLLFADTNGVSVELCYLNLVHKLSSTYYIAARNYSTHSTIIPGHVLVDRSSNAKLLLSK